MPTFRHGKSASFRLDNASNTLTALSDVCDEINFPREVESGETTTFGSQAKTYIVGLSDSTISISGKHDATSDGVITSAIAALQAGTIDSLSFEYGPEGNNVGRVKYTGECIVTSYETSSPVADVVSFSLELQNTGPVTRGTF